MLFLLLGAWLVVLALKVAVSNPGMPVFAPGFSLFALFLLWLVVLSVVCFLELIFNFIFCFPWLLSFRSVN